MEKDLNYYSIIPGKVMSSEKLTDKAKLVFGVITALSNKYGYCNAKNQYLADVFKITPTWISKILAQLKKEKCIKITYVAKERRIYPIMDAFGGVMSMEKREGKSATPAKSKPTGKGKPGFSGGKEKFPVIEIYNGFEIYDFSSDPNRREYTPERQKKFYSNIN